jgi:type IV secretion system protein VirB8
LFNKKNKNTDDPDDQRTKKLVEQLSPYINDWGDVAVLRAKRSQKTAWIIAIVSAVICALSVIALLALTPLKTVVPMPVIVDQTTGEAEVLTKIDTKVFSANEAINRYWVAKYVRLRERYNWHTIEDDGTEVYFLSIGQERNRYAAANNPQNPLAPMIKWNEEVSRTVEINSITSLGSNGNVEDKDLVSYQVRFTVFHTKGQTVTQKNYISTVTFKYFFEQSMNERARRRNPLGFAVTLYQREEEL